MHAQLPMCPNAQLPRLRWPRRRRLNGISCRLLCLMLVLENLKKIVLNLRMLNLLSQNENISINYAYVHSIRRSLLESS